MHKYGIDVEYLVNFCTFDNTNDLKNGQKVDEQHQDDALGVGECVGELHGADGGHPQAGGHEQHRQGLRLISLFFVLLDVVNGEGEQYAGRQPHEGL